MLSEKYLDGFRRWRQLPNVPSSVLTNPNVMDGVTLPRQKGRHVDVVFAALVLMLDFLWGGVILLLSFLATAKKRRDQVQGGIYSIEEMKRRL